MAELENNLKEADKAQDVSPAAPNLSPAKGKDLLIYLFGGVGLYFLASMALGASIEEINLTTTLMISLLNFVCLAGSVVIFGILRNKISWQSMGIFPQQKILRYAMIGGGLAFAIIPIRLLVGALGLWVENLIFGELRRMNAGAPSIAPASPRAPCCTTGILCLSPLAFAARRMATG